MMRKFLPSLRQNIIAQIGLLLCLFLVSYAGLIIGHSLLEQRQVYLQGLLKNEETKLELSHILQKDLLDVNVKLIEMSKSVSDVEVTRILKIIGSKYAEIMDLLQVVEQGGVKTVAYSVNFDNVPFNIRGGSVNCEVKLP